MKKINLSIENFTLLKLDSKEKNKEDKALIITGTTIKLLNELHYSEIDENNYIYLNNNDYGNSGFTIEINFNNIFNTPYMNFYANCFRINIDEKIIIKGNINYKDNIITKINKNGNIVIGLGYFFKEENEYNILKNSKSIIIEGYVAFEKTKNIYGIMCNLIKDKDIWTIDEANTYRNITEGDIKSLLL